MSQIDFTVIALVIITIQISHGFICTWRAIDELKKELKK